ncbi:alpha/beta fold hydrolase [Parashewanella curva]|uniref:Alpha/beta fold hydrolase n=1 Tax=Parashewanella curva TaxID=2338552 RepID=A0A3L8PW95_9GAMM|nr:alpha/beta fold hydrolase [Parashewanella curva]RLV58893.1 alpha/beta fold hydrolase [Parashewanella curva]
MNYVVSGQGPSIILIHGLFGNLDNLKNLAQHLETDYQVIRIDLPNHGASPHIDNLNFDIISQQLLTVFNELHIEKAHFVGHSLGGKAAMAFALNNSNKCLSVIAADIAPAKYPRRHDSVFNALTSLPLNQGSDRKAALQHLVSSGIETPTAQFLLKNLQRNDTGFTWKMNLQGLLNSYETLIDWPYQRIQYTGPCLFIRGGNSDYITQEHRQDILSQFPKVQAKTIHETGHWLHAEKPMVFNRIVKEFIDSQNQ